MQLDGIYQGENVNTPSGIRATGTLDEFKRIGPLPMRGATISPGGVQSVDFPAEKPLVRQIAKTTEIDCTDQRLIDWMAQG